MNASTFRDMSDVFKVLKIARASAICIGNHMISSAIWNK